MYDVITTHLAYKWGLGESELFPVAAILMATNYLWLGKLIAIGGVGVCCGWLVGVSEIKKAIKGLYMVNSICIVVVVLNLVSLGWC